MLLKRSLYALGLCFGMSVVTSQAQSTLAHTAPEAHYRNGLEYFEKSNFVAARQEFSEYLQKQDKLLSTSDYNTVTAEYYIAVTALYLDYPEAEVQIDRFVRNHSEHPKAQLIFNDLGRYYFEVGEFQKAITYLEKAVANPISAAKKVESSYRLGMSYYKTNQFDRALAAFNTVKADPTFENAADASFYAGVINYRNGNYQEAYTDFQRVENHPYYKSEAPNWIVSSLYQLKRFDELVTYGERVLNQQQRGNTKLDDVALYVAEVYYEKGDYKAAAPAYERYKRMKAGTLPPAVALHYGHSLFRADNFTAAVDAMKGIATGKDSVAQYASYLVGISYLKLNNPNFALTAFDNASRLTFNPTVREEATFNHAKVLLELGNNNDAIKEFNEYLTRYPGSKHEEETNQLIADAYAGASNNTGAISYIESIRNRTPKINATYQRLTYNQGVTDFNLERYDQALANFNKSLRYPVDEEVAMAANYQKAESLAAQKKTTEAVELYTQLSRNSKAGMYGRKSLYALGYIFYNQKNYSRANGYFKDFVANTAGMDSQIIEDAHVRLADTYLAAKNYNEAIRTYDQVSAKGEVDKDYALFQKGRAYIYMNRDQDARRQFEQLISQFPGSRYVDDALFQMADVEFQNKSYQQAVRSFTRLINEKPKSYMIPAALLRRGQAYFNIQVYEQSINDFRRVLTEFPASPSANSALEGIQESFNAVGRPEEFAQVLSVVRKNNPGNTKLEEVEFENARNLFYAEKYPAAIKSLENFMDSYPGSKYVYDARYLIGASYEKTDNIPQALQYYRLVVQENRSAFVASAAQKSAELEIARGNYNQAVTNFRILLRNAENKKEQSTAWVGLMNTYYTLKNYDSTLYYAREVVNLGNIVPGGTARAQLYFGKVPYARGDYAKATEEFRKVVATSKDEYGAEAKYWLSDILFRTKKFKEAEKSIFDLSKEFEGYDYWRVRSFILLAEVYMGMNEVAQAKATLNSIIENSDDQDAVVLAKEKLNEINRR
jgi:tetratricopeptide (TPR) repeat protein